ncbi:MAG: radical SAM protein [Elusimicrobia bacterium]|nr:radical SAM protein [Elusimicrobiota bacterium]
MKTEEADRNRDKMTGRDRLNNRKLNEIEIAQKKTVLESRPRSLVVRLTTRCNLNCIMCDSKDGAPDLSAKVIGEVRDMFRYLEFVTWLGGEVFLSDIFEGLFTQAASWPGLFQNIATNGLLIDERWARILTGARVNLTLSIDGVRKETYEKIRTGARFEKLTSNLDMLNRYKDGHKDGSGGINLSMQMVGLKENIDDIGEAAGFMKKHRINQLIIVPLKSSINDPSSIYNEHEVKEGMKRSLDRLYKAAEKNGFRIINGLPISPGQTASDAARRPRDKDKQNGGPGCLYPWQQMIVSSDGEVALHCLCPFGGFGNANDSGILEIWNGEKFREIRRKVASGGNGDCCNISCVSGVIPSGVLRID